MKRTSVVVLLLLLTVTLVACGGTYTYENASAYRATSGELVLDAETVQSLDIDWVSGTVQIEEWEGDSVKLKENAEVSLSIGDRFRYFLDGETLRVRFMQDSILGADVIQKDLCVLVPKGMSFIDLELNTDSADVKVSSIQCTRCVVETVSGDVDVQLTGACQLLEFDTISGDSKLVCEELSHLEVDAISGNVLLKAQTLPGDGKITTLSGDVELHFPEDSGFTIEYESASGKLTSELSLTLTDTRYVCGNGGARYQIETKTGNVCVRKLK